MAIDVLPTSINSDSVGGDPPIVSSSPVLRTTKLTPQVVGYRSGTNSKVFTISIEILGSKFTLEGAGGIKCNGTATVDTPDVSTGSTRRPQGGIVCAGSAFNIISKEETSTGGILIGGLLELNPLILTTNLTVNVLATQLQDATVFMIAVEVLGYPFDGTGVFVHGFGNEQIEYYTPSEDGIICNGTSIQELSFAPSGSALCNGTATIIQNFTTYGGIICNGTTSINKITEIQTNNGAKIGGSATIVCQYNPTIVNQAAILAGSSTVHQRIFLVGDDGTVIAGTAIVDNFLPAKGGARLGGTANTTFFDIFVPSGGATGGSSIKLNMFYSSQLNGASGGSRGAGSAFVIMAKLFFYTTSGSVVIDGLSPFLIGKSHTPSGGVTMSGTHDVFLFGWNYIYNRPGKNYTVKLEGTASPQYRRFTHKTIHSRIYVRGSSDCTMTFLDNNCKGNTFKCEVDYPNQHKECFTSEDFYARKGRARVVKNLGSAKLPAITICRQNRFLPPTKD